MKRNSYKNKQLIALLIVLVFCLTAFNCLCLMVGCKKEYNSELFSHAKQWISAEFLKENRVKAFYPNEDYVEGRDNPRESHIYDKTAPSSRVFIITEQDEFDKIFTNYNSTVDLKSKTVVLYILSDFYPGRVYYLQKLQLDDKTLTVYYKLEDRGDILDATSPYQRCFMLVLDKIEFDEVNFIEQR